MENARCITCKCDLKDHCKATPDWQWAYCTLCGATYLIQPALNEYGQPVYMPDGRQCLYLEPVRPGDPNMYREDDTVPPPPVEHVDADAKDFNEMKTIIEDCTSVNDFLKKLK